MKSLGSLVLLLSACSVSAVVPLSNVQRKTNLPFVPNKFIVEVDSDVDIPTPKRGMVSPHKRLYEHLRTRDVKFDVTREYKEEGLFVGSVLTLHSPQDVAALQGAPGVKAIRPVQKFNRPEPASQRVVTGPNDPSIPPDSESTHILTGVDKLHAQGITGKGIKIGIIDTGIDYTHPSLGGTFGPGNKVIGGFDLVGDAYDGTNTPIPDNDPLDQCDGHGTYVAGIIGANPGNEFGISGVAYEASLTSYRVFGCQGFVGDDVLIDAMLMGFKDGQDILNLSLGDVTGWTESTIAVVASRIAGRGTIVASAAGNNGESGAWATEAPAIGINVISVASIDNTVIPLQNATVGGAQHDPIPYFLANPLLPGATLPIYATSNLTTVPDDACDPLPDTTPDLSDKLVLIRRGTCTFVQKLTNAAAKGAKAMLIYDNGTGFNGIMAGGFLVAEIRAADGEFLVQQFAAGVPVTLTFPQSGGAANIPDPTGGLISSFSTYGPTNDFFFKPTLAAPGGNILSTYPVPLGSYVIASGTSGATPVIAGGAALVLQAKGKTTDVTGNMKSLLQSTAKKVPSSKTDGDPLQTVAQQGTGLVNVFDAVGAETLVTPTELVVNDTLHAKPIQTFTVRNTGQNTKMYRLNHVPAGTALTVRAGTIFPALGPVPLVDAPAHVTLLPSNFTLQPGASQQIIATIFPPVIKDTSTYPVYSGFIEVTDGTQNFHVAYLGLIGSLIDKRVIDNTDNFFGFQIPVILDGEGKVQDVPTNYTFFGEDFPSLLWRQTFGSPHIQIDLVDPNINLKTSLTPRVEAQNAPLFTFPIPGAGTFAQVKTIGSVFSFDYLSRSEEDPATENICFTFSWQTRTFTNGTAVLDGSYRLLLRTLRATGNPQREEDYDAYLSPIFGIITQ